MIGSSRNIIVALIAMLALSGVSVASAQAAPFTMSVDNAILDLGGIEGVRAIDSDLGDPPATLTGDLTGSDVNVPKAGFVFPTKTAELSPGISADIDMEANDDITGTYDASTGSLSLNVSLKATVAVLGSTCVISPIVLQLSTESARPYLGQTFSSGIEQAGVVSASWAGLPPVQQIAGVYCPTVTSLIAGPGGIAMSHGVHDFKTCETEPSNPLCGIVAVPSLAPTLNSAPSSSTDETSATFTFVKGSGELQPVDGFECSLDNGAPEPCDSGTKEYTGLAVGEHSFQVKATNSAGSGPAASYSWTITKPAEVCPPGTTGTPPNCVTTPPRRARLANLKVAPKVKAVRRGKKTVIRVKVRNAGNAAAKGVRVCVTAPKRLVKVKKCVRVGGIAAKKTKVARFQVKAKRKKSKAVLKFKATSQNAGKKAGRATVRVK